MAEIEQRLPDDLFDERTSFERAELVTYGGGHTASDAFLYLPDARVLFAADLVVVRSHPWVGHGDVSSWRGILERMQELDFEVLVPGHGPVGGREDVDAMLGYLDDLAAAAERRNEDAPMPERYRDWDFADGWRRNLAALVSLE